MLPGLAIQKQTFDYQAFFVWLVKGTRRNGFKAYRRMSHQKKRNMKLQYLASTGVKAQAWEV
jgi:hypothetical protein